MNQFLSSKQAVYAHNGVVATSDGLAAQAGLDILKKGGNAIDAAIATAACLTVTEPCSNGIGSDCFAIVFYHGNLYGMNASGKSSRNITIEKVTDRGFDQIPKYGVIPITVPGTPKGWASLSARFGKLSLIEVLQPAIKLAEKGFVISQHLGFYFENAIKHYEINNKGPEFESFFKVFKNNGLFYKAGDIFQSHLMAKTLEEIGLTNSDSFYKGELAGRIVDFMEKNNGFIDREDLFNLDVSWVEPISVKYKGFDVFELPPNGQGITALMALNILKNKSFDRLDFSTFHEQIEAIKIAFSDTLAYVTDPDFMKINPEYLLSEEYASLRRNEIDETAKEYTPYDYKKGGTVYLATADKDGNMVSFIQSNYMGFGSGIVIDDTGISMQNRGHTFSMDKSHHNCLAPNKRTYHTIIPGFIMKNKKPIGPFGVMGGFMQPQGHLQVLMNMIDFKMNPQAALDAPRFFFDEGLKVQLENTFNPEIAKFLEARGHEITISNRSAVFGRGQIIIKNNNYYLAGTETRCDGFIAYY
jgi:gamma-glutamyltranspeptidase/glutathione hydrolase